MSRPVRSLANAKRKSSSADDDDGAWLDAMNQRYALVKMGTGVAVLDFTRSLHGQPAFLTLESFHAWCLKDEPVRWTDKDGKAHSAAASRLWIKHPKRRDYDSITFDPRLPPGGGGRVFNRFQGFPIAPRAGSCKLFKDHLLTNVAGGNREHFRWLVGWFAQIVQRPAERPGTAIVLIGRQGTGKGFPLRVIGRLLGSSYLMLSALGQLTGRFNDHLGARLLVHLDEASAALDPAAAGKLRALVTEQTVLIEAKNLSAYPEPNFARVALTGEHEHLVVASLEERRFAVFQVAETAMQNHEYFAEIEAELEAGGYAALMHELLSFDLSTVDLRRIPKTDALWRQKVRSMDPMRAWLYLRLCEGDMPTGTPWPTELETGEFRLTKREVYDDFLGYCDRRRVYDRADETRFGMFLKQHLPQLRTVKVPRESGGRMNGWSMPDLATARAAFAERIGQPIEWPTEEDLA